MPRGWAPRRVCLDPEPDKDPTAEEMKGLKSNRVRAARRPGPTLNRSKQGRAAVFQNCKATCVSAVVAVSEAVW